MILGMMRDTHNTRYTHDTFDLRMIYSSFTRYLRMILVIWAQYSFVTQNILMIHIFYVKYTQYLRIVNVIYAIFTQDIR